MVDRVEPGEGPAVLGANGSGKTRLFKTILRLQSALCTTVTLDPRDLEDLSVAERARAFGFVPQAIASPFACTASEIVLMDRAAQYVAALQWTIVYQ